jgi:hypothetical protein
MKQYFPWEANPARKFFEILLALFWGYSLGMNKTYQRKTFGAKERAHIKAELEKLPDCSLKLLLLIIIDIVGSPPESFKIKNFKFKSDKDKLIYTHEIMAIPGVFFRTAGLALLNKKSVAIFSNIKNSLFQSGFKEDHFARFLSQFWNTGLRNGYSRKSRMTLEKLIESIPELKSCFKPLLEGALSDKCPAEIMALYDIKLHSYQESTLNIQTLQNIQLALYQASRKFSGEKQKFEQTRNLKEFLTIYPDLMDLIQNENSSEIDGNLLDSFNMGGGNE